MFFKNLIIFLIFVLITKSSQFNFDKNYCLKTSRIESKTPANNKLIINSAFSLDLSSDNYVIDSKNSLIIKIISSLNNNNDIRKVIIQAKLLSDDDNDERVLGSWNLPVESKNKVIDCFGKQDTILNNDFHNENFEWNLEDKSIPNDSSVYFGASIIGSDDKLTNIKSNLVKLVNLENDKNLKSSLTSESKTRSKRNAVEFFRSSTQQCGLRRSCYVSLNTCDIDPKTCNFVLSWEYDGQLINYELTGLSHAWIAVVLSQDRYLGNDNIIVCSRYADNEKLSIDHYFKKKDDSTLYKIEPDDYLKNKEITFSQNGAYINCKFSRPKTVDNEFVSDLSQPHYVYVERGAPGEMIVDKLNRLFQPSESQVEFANSIYVPRSTRSWLVKVHAILGIIAWVFLGSIGILLARYYKPLWPNHVLHSFRVWFSFHRSIMIFVTLLSLLSLLFALVELNWGWSSNGHDYLHSVLGAIVIICSCINPILGFFRPSPTSYLRCLYFWCHWLVGVVAYCLAIPTIFIGMDLGKSDVPNWCSWVLFAWVIFHIIVELVLEIHYCCTFSQLQGNYSEKNTDYDKINKIPIKKKNPPGFRWKPSLLFVYSIVTALVVSALIIAIFLLD
ncbi:unnamed protein product [Brachionus calyciflorus]|uniref:ascorbate ferrireductase (transmembrane) n=1 Tax=Brachionus calyciflorus TaxID=104777 RepID=A0A813R3C8_9BILA|nr:unnamed protein product [Brachionus calyciflorus]